MIVEFLFLIKKNKIPILVEVGCGCVASVFSGYLYKMLEEHKLNRILLIATGALMNSTSSQQGESIPGIAHAIAIENL